MRLTTTKLYVDSAASRTVTQEILVADTMAPNKKTLWITVEYIDNATGLPKHISTRDFSGALDTVDGELDRDSLGHGGSGKTQV